MNLAFFVSGVTCAYSLYRGIVTDPGYVPKPVNDSEVKLVSKPTKLGTLLMMAGSRRAGRRRATEWNKLLHQVYGELFADDEMCE